MRLETSILALLLIGLLAGCKEEPSLSDTFLFAQFRVEGNNCTAPCQIAFFNESTNAKSFNWDFGNGQNSQEENPSATYDTEGTYTVTLTIGNNEGEEKSTSQDIQIGSNSSDLNFITGMDMSYQAFLEDFQVDFKDEAGNSIDNMWRYTQENGVNLIRLRLFHTPSESNSVVFNGGLPQVLEMAQQIKESGNNFLLDFHYSDTWADPGKQFVPAAWDGKPFAEIQDSIYHYTKHVLQQLNAQNTLPEMIQIGNEINSGMLWDYGKVWNEFNDNWGQLAALINSANQAITEIETATGKDIQTMIHVAGINNASFFFDELISNGAAFDLIGLSYYPWWHGKDLNEIENNLINLANTFNKPIVIAETSYPFTLGWNDWTDNVAGSEDVLIEGYAATPEGQRDFYNKLVTILKNLPNEKGKGFIWWAPDYVAFNGSESTEGSAFENLCTFDFDNKALPVMEVFRNN